MVTKRRTRSTKKVKSLKAKSLKANQVKGVRGGGVTQGVRIYTKEGHFS